MTTMISIKSALKLLTLFRSQRMTKEERGRVDSAIAQLSRAQVDPDYARYLHTPKRGRPTYADWSGGEETRVP